MASTLLTPSPRVGEKRDGHEQLHRIRGSWRRHYRVNRPGNVDGVVLPKLADARDARKSGGAAAKFGGDGNGRAARGCGDCAGTGGGEIACGAAGKSNAIRSSPLDLKPEARKRRTRKCFS